jgi:Flp pilus assembly protein TadG
MFRGIARKSKQEGQAMVETALMIMVVLLLLLGIIEFGFLFYGYVRVSNSAREGARAGSLWLMHPSNPTLCEQVRQSVWSELPAVEDSGTVTITLVDGNVACGASPTLERGDPITVTVGYDFDLPVISGMPIIRDIISSPYPVSRAVVMRIQ